MGLNFPGDSANLLFGRLLDGPCPTNLKCLNCHGKWGRKGLKGPGLADMEEWIYYVRPEDQSEDDNP